MARKKFWLLGALLGLSLLLAAAPALAWEFSMTGEAEFRYRYWSRLGNGDLFGGPAGINAAGVATGTIGFAGPQYNFFTNNALGVNIQNQMVQVQGFSAKGSDASIQCQRVWVYPEVRINPAIRLRGEYWLTGTNLRGHHANIFSDGLNYIGDNYSLPLGYTGWYISNDGSNGSGLSQTGMSVGMWEKLWVTAQLPWGVFVAGRRPVDFGLGWSTVHAKDLSDEPWTLVVPYGPFHFIAGMSFRDAGGDQFTENAAANLSGAAATGLTVAMGTDKNRIRAGLDARFAFTYTNGPVNLGSLAIPIYQWNTHTGIAPFSPVPAGPAGADDFNNAVGPVVFLGAGSFLDNLAVPLYGDIRYVLWVNFFKYFDGRFFFNAEYDFEYADAPRKGGRPISAWADAWEFELGLLCGPAKLSLANFYHSGDDRRGGFLDYWGAVGGPSVYHPGTSVYDKQTQFLVFSGVKECIAPYQYLIGLYGTGNNSYDLRGHGAFHDFLAWAARLDYAVAANLNVFTSFMYANRASNTGTPVGAYRGGVLNVGPRAHPGFAAGYRGTYGAVGAPLGLVTGVGQIAPIPNVPDNYLGWEWDAGLNWKLLEGLTFNALFAYWQPGDWFKWAYVDFGSFNTTVINGVPYPVTPQRGIDALLGFEGSFLVNF